MAGNSGSLPLAWQGIASRHKGTRNSHISPPIEMHKTRFNNGRILPQELAFCEAGEARLRL